MRWLLRVGAFIFGGIVATLIVGILDEAFPWIWLPLLFGAAVSGVVASQNWLRGTSIAAAFCSSVTSGATLTFCLSTIPITGQVGPKFPVLVRVFGMLVFVVCFAFFLGRGLRQSSSRGLTLWLTIPVLASCVVGYVSGGIGGGDHMVHWLMSVTSLAREQAETIVHFFRKGIHLSAYGIVGMCLFRGGIAGRAIRSKALLFAMSTVLCLASFDELRQTTAPNRTGSAWDVTLDMTGALLFIVVAAALLKPKKRPANGVT